MRRSDEPYSARLIARVRQSLIDFKDHTSESSKRHAALISGVSIDGGAGSYIKKAEIKLVSGDNLNELINAEQLGGRSIIYGDKSYVIIEVVGNKKNIVKCYKKERLAESERQFDFERIDPQIRSIVLFELYFYAEFILANVNTCANIAKLGSFDVETIFIPPNAVIPSFNRPNVVSSTEPKEFYEKKNLTLIEELAFVDVWDWFKSKKGILEGKPITDVERAVCCFASMYFGESESTGARDLIWSFAGLEALLAHGESGILIQLRSNLHAIFKDKIALADFDKYIKDIYSYRSKIVHGKASIPSALRSKIYFSEKMRRDSLDHTEFVKILLIALFQYCIQRKIDGFEFRTVLVDGS